MLNERERAIKNALMEGLGGPASFIDPRRSVAYVDSEYLRMTERRMAVNNRRMVIFAVLYGLVLLTAVAVVTMTLKDYNVVLWVIVGTFNAVNAAIHYAEYQKKKLAFAVFDLLGEEKQEV